jgi:hypothetical protein
MIDALLQKEHTSYREIVSQRDDVLLALLQLETDADQLP